MKRAVREGVSVRVGRRRKDKGSWGPGGGWRGWGRVIEGVGLVVDGMGLIVGELLLWRSCGWEGGVVVRLRCSGCCGRRCRRRCGRRGGGGGGGGCRCTEAFCCRSRRRRCLVSFERGAC